MRDPHRRAAQLHEEGVLYTNYGEEPMTLVKSVSRRACEEIMGAENVA